MANENNSFMTTYVLYRAASFMDNPKVRTALLPSILTLRDTLHATMTSDTAGGVLLPSPKDIANDMRTLIHARTKPLGLPKGTKTAAAGSFVSLMTITGQIPRTMAQLSPREALRRLLTEAIMELPTIYHAINDRTRHVHYRLYCARNGITPVNSQGRGRGGRGGRGQARAPPQPQPQRRGPGRPRRAQSEAIESDGSESDGGGGGGGGGRRRNGAGEEAAPSQITAPGSGRARRGI
jgi:hypothetical protein